MTAHTSPRQNLLRGTQPLSSLARPVCPRPFHCGSWVYPQPSPWLRVPLSTPAMAFCMACGAAPSSQRPSALQQSTLFNLGEGNTSAFPSQHLFSVANPGNTRPFYLLRKEWIITTFLPGSFPLFSLPTTTSLLKWKPLCYRHCRAVRALKQHSLSCSHLLCAIVSARLNNSTIVIITLCTNTNELVNRGPTKIKLL